MAFEQPLPSALSPSRLADFQACPRRYQHASIERIPQPASYATAKGRFVHYVFEHLFLLPPDERTLDAARRFVEPAQAEILTEDVRREINLDEAMLERLLRETDGIIPRYFEKEDPSTVATRGV